jgi:hypothetical protein
MLDTVASEYLDMPAIQLDREIDYDLVLRLGQDLTDLWVKSNEVGCLIELPDHVLIDACFVLAYFFHKNLL